MVVTNQSVRGRRTLHREVGLSRLWRSRDDYLSVSGRWCEEPRGCEVRDSRRVQLRGCLVVLEFGWTETNVNQRKSVRPGKHTSLNKLGTHARQTCRPLQRGGTRLRLGGPW